MTDLTPPSQLAAAIAQAAAREDPSLPAEAGHQLALSCLAELRANPSASPADLARRVLAGDPDAEVSWANHVARLTLLFVGRN